MDIEKIVEAISQSNLPFVYSGERLNDENCKKALKKIGVEGTVLGVIAANALVGLEGLAVTEKGIWYALSNISTGDMGIPAKTKGTWLFDKIIIHKVITVKKTPILPSFEVGLLLWDIEKSKSSTVKIKLTEDNLEFKDSMVQELEDIFNTLTSKTGTEYVEPETAQNADGQPLQAVEKDPNTFDFIYGMFGSLHTIIELKDNDVIIRKLKIDEKTKIQTPKGNPIIISRSAIDSVKLKRAFSTVPLLTGIVFGAFIGIFIATIIMILLGAIGGLIFSFPKTMFIYRKDGIKFKTVVRGSEDEYERLIKALFDGMEKESSMNNNDSLESKITSILEKNQVLKKLGPNAKVIGLGIIAALIIITAVISANAGPSTKKLEKQVMTAIIKENNMDITGLTLIKRSKGVYTGKATANTIFGGTVVLNVEVITDGRSFQWEISY